MSRNINNSTSSMSNPMNPQHPPASSNAMDVDSAPPTSQSVFTEFVNNPAYQRPGEPGAENEAEECSAEDAELEELSEHDDEEEKKPEPKKKKKQKHCQIRGCTLLAVKDKDYCSGCGRSRLEKKARALRRKNRRLDEKEHEYNNKYQRYLIKKKQAERKEKLEKKMKLLKEKCKK